MIVTVYYARSGTEVQGTMMIIPEDTEPQVVGEINEFEWQLVGSTSLSDNLFAEALPVIEAQIAVQGYAVLKIAFHPRYRGVVPTPGRTMLPRRSQKAD